LLWKGSTLDPTPHLCWPMAGLVVTAHQRIKDRAHQLGSARAEQRTQVPDHGSSEQQPGGEMQAVGQVVELPLTQPV